MREGHMKGGREKWIYFNAYVLGSKRRGGREFANHNSENDPDGDHVLLREFYDHMGQCYRYDHDMFLGGLSGEEHRTQLTGHWFKVNNLKK
jgi:hypothetical protein